MFYIHHANIFLFNLQSITEKQAKELRETREGRNLFLENLNNRLVDVYQNILYIKNSMYLVFLYLKHIKSFFREKQIQAIEESFKAAKLAPVHQTNPNLKPVEILPLLPNFDRYELQFNLFVIVS